MTESERTILAACRQGNTEAFKTLVETYQHYAFRVAFRLLSDSEGARDVVQESFIRIWKHRRKIDPQKKFTTWLYRIVTNLCYDRLKSPAARTDSLDSALSERLVSGENPEKSVSDKEIVDIIHRFIRFLAPKQKLVFVLRDIECLSMKEVSAITGIRTGAVKTHLYLARRAVRNYLKELGIYHA